MARRVNSLVYALPTMSGSAATVSSASYIQGQEVIYPTMSLYVPESASRIFQCALVELFFMDAATSGTSGITVANWKMNSQLGSAAPYFISCSNPQSVFTGTGEQHSYMLTADFTKYFNTAFGTAQSQSLAFQWSVSGSGGIALPGTTNHNVRLYLTYEYDDAGTMYTMSKTVYIPVLSPSGTISTITNGAPTWLGGALPDGAGAQWPNFDSLCPESNKVFDNVHILGEGNNNAASTQCQTLMYGLSDGTLTTYYTGAYDEQLNLSGRFIRTIVNIPSAVTTPAGQIPTLTTLTSSLSMSLKAVFGKGPVAVAPRWNHWLSYITATYRFSANLSSASITSAFLPVEMSQPFGPYANFQSKFERPIKFVQESGSAMVQSGFGLYWNDSAAITDLKVGARKQRGPRTYTPSVGTPAVGGYCLMHRIDSGSGYGPEGNFTTGPWNLEVNIGRGVDTADMGTLISGLFLLNYTSSLPHTGPGNPFSTNSRTTYWNLWSSTGSLLEFQPSASSATDYTTGSAPISASLPTPYWIGGIGIANNFHTNAATLGLTMDVYATHSDEDLSGSWVELYSDGATLASAAELGLYRTYARGADVFKRYYLDPDTSRLTLEKPHSWRLIAGNGGNIMGGAFLFVTFNQLTYLITGSLSGFTGDGSGIIVNVYKSGSNEFVTGSRSVAPGTFTASVYDQWTPMYCTALQDGTHLGRSNDSYAAKY